LRAGRKAMRTNYFGNRRGGHCPGHVRDTFLAAIEAYLDWSPGEPEPTVEHEVGYVPRQIPISAACRLVWNCSDCLPGQVADQLLDAGLPMTLSHLCGGGTGYARRSQA